MGRRPERMEMEREAIEFDVLFVGGGPAGLAGAIRLMQLAKQRQMNLEVALIDKGADIGSHALSGAVLNPVALAELLPDFRERGCPMEAAVTGDALYFLTPKRALPIPLVPRQMHNTGHFVVSLAKFTGWLAGVAEEMGVNIFPGFAGREVLFDPAGNRISGVRTGDKGIDRDGAPKDNFEPGIDLLAKTTVFAEGARGSLIRQIEQRLPIFEGRMPQIFETGIKEVIQLPDHDYFAAGRGNTIHTLGYPLELSTPGGGFIYQMNDNRVAIGYLVGLGYRDPWLDPYDVFIRFKQHPFVRNILKEGRVVEQGARTVSTGGYYTMPALVLDGALIAGAAAGFHHTPALKGVHSAMKSGMLAAEAIAAAFEEDDFSSKALARYEALVADSWLQREMLEGRNVSQALAKSGLMKLVHLGAQYVSGGRGIRDRMPITADCETLKDVGNDRLRPPDGLDKEVFDGVLMVDKLTGVYLSKTNHREDQPCHIVIHDTDLCIRQCYETYRSPCTRFCPGNVYEIVDGEDGAEKRLKLNPANCLHCKTCDVKDPYGNITWTCPEGGDGPGYSVV